MLVAVLRMLQEGRALSLDLAQAIIASIRFTLLGVLSPAAKSQEAYLEEDLARSLSLLKAAEHTHLTESLLGRSLSFLGMRARTMPWVQAASERLALGGHLSQVRACRTSPLPLVLQLVCKALFCSAISFVSLLEVFGRAFGQQCVTAPLSAQQLRVIYTSLNPRHFWFKSQIFNPKPYASHV